MGRIVIVAYRPHPGKEAVLAALVKEHHAILYQQDLVTDRKPVIMRASNHEIVEVFEWRSADAIERAHHNPQVAILWERFSEACTYVIPTTIKEFNNMFSEFESID